jgi:hypothetical protein
MRDRSGSLADPPSEVQVTVVTRPRSRRRRSADARSLVAVGVIATALALAGIAMVAVVLSGGRAERATATARVSATPGAERPTAVEEAYRYPLGCLGRAIAETRYVAARSDRESPCWRYGVYITAIFHRVDGVWRLALEERGAACPPRSLPSAVRAQIAVCHTTAAHAAYAAARRPGR